MLLSNCKNELFELLCLLPNKEYMITFIMLQFSKDREKLKDSWHECSRLKTDFFAAIFAFDWFKPEDAHLKGFYHATNHFGSFKVSFL